MDSWWSAAVARVNTEEGLKPGSLQAPARPEATGSAWEPSPGFAAGSTADRAIGVQADAYAPEAAGLAPLKAYVLGFKRGTAAAHYIVQDVAASLHDFHITLARARPPETAAGSP